MNTPAFMNVGEVAHELQVSPVTVYRKTLTGEIPSIRIGRTIRIPRWVVQKLNSQPGEIVKEKENQ